MDVGRFFGTELFGFCKADVLRYVETSANEHEEEKAKLKKEISELSAKLKEAENTIAIVSAQYDNQMNIIKSKEEIIRDMTKNLAVCKQKIRQFTLNNAQNSNIVPKQAAAENAKPVQNQNSAYTEKLEKDVQNLRNQLNNYVNNVKDALSPFIKNASSHAESMALAVDKLQKEISSFKKMAGLESDEKVPQDNRNSVKDIPSKQSDIPAYQEKYNTVEKEYENQSEKILGANSDINKKPQFIVKPKPQLQSKNFAESDSDIEIQNYTLSREHGQSSDIRKSNIISQSVPDIDESTEYPDSPEITDEQLSRFMTSVEDVSPSNHDETYSTTNRANPKNYDDGDDDNSISQISIPRTIDPTIDGKDIEAFLNMDIDSIINPDNRNNI